MSLERKDAAMIKLIASDLDGTLLQKGAQQLTLRALELIRRLTDRGICFAAASGRQYDNEVRLFGEVGDRISYIAENGSICIHRGEVVSRTVIDQNLIQRIIDEVKKDGRFEILISREDSCFIEGRDPVFVNHIVNVLKNTTRIVEDVRDVEGPILKIAIGKMEAGPNMVKEYLRYLQGKFQKEIRVVTSGNVWIDFIAPGTNKGTALLSLLDRLQIKPEECMAFGDQYNDVEMLQAAGVSYAMANAVSGISEYADYVTDSVEDVLEELLHSQNI